MARKRYKPAFRSCSRRVARPAANSFTCFVWITPRAFCIAAPRLRQASVSARSRTPAAFATTHISRGDFATGSATRQAVAPKEKQCAPVRAKGRLGPTTSGLRLVRSCPQDRSRSSTRIKSRACAGYCASPRAEVSPLCNEIRRLTSLFCATEVSARRRPEHRRCSSTRETGRCSNPNRHRQFLARIFCEA